MAIIRKLILSGIVLLLIYLYACQQPGEHTGRESQQHAARLKILTTIVPLYCFAINITGDHADVQNLLPPGAEPHGYSFSPADVKKITGAHVLIKNGVNLETWLDKLTASSGRKNIMVVDTSIGLELIDENPHIWLSPKNAIIQTENILKALVKLEPRHGEIYKANAEKYIRCLKALDAEIQKESDGWRKKEFVAFHPAFLYLAKDYGLKQTAVIRESPEKEPSPKHIANVINTIKAAGIKALFSEPRVSNKILRAIAKDLNLRVYTLDTLETGTPHPEWYEDRMRSNLAVLKKALGGGIE